MDKRTGYTRSKYKILSYSDPIRRDGPSDSYSSAVLSRLYAIVCMNAAAIGMLQVIRRFYRVSVEFYGDFALGCMANHFPCQLVPSWPKEDEIIRMSLTIPRSADKFLTCAKGAIFDFEHHFVTTHTPRRQRSRHVARSRQWLQWDFVPRSSRTTRCSSRIPFDSQLAIFWSYNARTCTLMRHAGPASRAHVPGTGLQSPAAFRCCTIRNYTSTWGNKQKTSLPTSSAGLPRISSSILFSISVNSKTGCGIRWRISSSLASIEDKWRVRHNARLINAA